MNNSLIYHKVLNKKNRLLNNRREENIKKINVGSTKIINIRTRNVLIWKINPDNKIVNEPNLNFFSADVL